MTATAIPVIDLTRPRETVVQELAGIYETLGFAQIIGHGVDRLLVDEVFAAADRFHALSASDKQALARDRNHRGYIGPGTSIDRASEIETATEPNQSESFMLMRDAAPEDADVIDGVYLAGPNQWPPLAGFQTTMERYQVEMGRLAERVLGMFFEALAVEPPAGAFDPATTWLRLLRYPPLPAVREGAFGSAPHVDFGAVTLLAQDDVGGLQVLAPGASWIDVEPIDGTFVLNTGAAMRRWSGGRFKATAHRVNNHHERPRRSVAYFHDPHMRTPIEALVNSPSSESDGSAESTVFADLVRRELTASYTDEDC